MLSRSAYYSRPGTPPVVHHIVQIGGVPGLIGPHLQAADTADTWLVEADPDAVLGLRIRLHGSRTVVLGAVLAPESGPLTWRVHEPRSFDGPHPMSKPLRDLCPGAAERGSRVVDGSGISDFFATLPEPRHGAAAALVVNMPNGGADLVCALDADALQRYDWVAVRLTKEFVFAGDATDRHVQEHLALCGFRCTDAVDAALFPFQHFAIDRAGIENARLRRALDTLGRELGEANESAAVARAQVQQQVKISAELTAEVSRLEAHLAQAQRESERSTTALSLRDSELAASAEVASQVPRLTEQLAKVQRDAERYAAMLALRDSDLRDLQQQHAEAVRLQDAYRDTLRELTVHVRDWIDRSSGDPAA